MICLNAREILGKDNSPLLFLRSPQENRRKIIRAMRKFLSVVLPEHGQYYILLDITPQRQWRIVYISHTPASPSTTAARA